jgi:hypothetical protein
MNASFLWQNLVTLGSEGQTLHYRAYCFDHERHIRAAADIEAVDDQDAIAQARAHFLSDQKCHSVQVWQAKRRFHDEILVRPLTTEG